MSSGPWHGKCKRVTFTLVVAVLELLITLKMFGLRPDLLYYIQFKIKFVSEAVDKTKRMSSLQKFMKRYSSVAEWLGSWTSDQQVAGSNPGRPTVECNPGQVVYTHVPCHQAV